MFDVQVHEIGTWSINITNNTSDTPSHVDVNGLEKDDIYVDDNPNDDLNDLNDKLNELAQATKDEEIHFDCPNTTNLNRPREQVEDEVIKVSDTCDLSRPRFYHTQTMAETRERNIMINHNTRCKIEKTTMHKL
ncbi:hypothetical protein Tco_0632809 [Tanacetum coccineum]